VQVEEELDLVRKLLHWEQPPVDFHSYVDQFHGISLKGRAQRNYKKTTH